MTNPVPGFQVTTPFGRRGRHWSCNRDASGNGIHTGDDWAAPSGTPIVAPIPGTVRHRSYGTAFGPNGFAIVPGPGQPFHGGEVFFAHTLDRPANGAVVQAGQRVARVGALGNATGPHLHMEYLPRSTGRWACGLHANPAPVINWQPSTPPSGGGGSWLIEGVIPMSASTIVYFSEGGAIFEARLLDGTFAHVPNPDVLRERRQSLDTSGIRWRDAGAANRARWGREVPWS